ncbi:MAG: hypothetical protein LBD01_01470 [Puniceicoccales bacterium]|nr:hypothetical protein [Puniceicoccales bacterium]
MRTRSGQQKNTRIGKRNVSYKNGEYSYKLWVPKGYDAEPKRRWPCVFIGSPTGNANMGPMGGHLKTSRPPNPNDKTRNKAKNLEAFIKSNPDTEAAERAKKFVGSMKSHPPCPEPTPRPAEMAKKA